MRPAPTASLLAPGDSSLPASQQPNFEPLLRKLGLRLELLCAEVLARAVPSDRARTEPAFAARLGDEVADSLAEQLRAFADVALPTALPDSAGNLARIAGDLDVALDLYRASHMVLWRAWFDLVEAESLDPTERRTLLRRGSDFLFAYAGRLGDLALERHRRRLEPGGEQRRFRAVADLLAGDRRAAAAIDFDLDRHHLGLIVWGEDPKLAARALAERLGRRLLIVERLEGERCCWAWISGILPLGPDQELVLRGFEPGQARLAVGLEAHGEAGFCASHRQALRARRFAHPDRAPLVHYADVAVEALAAENEEDARAFVANELRGIEDESARSRLLRETLEAYFATEYNAACAGAALGVHQQTVANRLRAAEERLGLPSIRARRVELEMALRLRSTLLAGQACDSLAGPAVPVVPAR